jgi:hypothetical protein
LSGPTGAFEQVLAALDRMEIPYFVGGSVASGSYGLPRQTNDIDIVADFSGADVPAFCNSLQSEFYIDATVASAAIKSSRPFNAIHLKGHSSSTSFLRTAEGFAQSELGRRRYVVSRVPGLEQVEFPISSPEDTALAKLVWCRKGIESDRQWHDILGILSVQAGRLDLAYMRGWADRLKVADLLAGC